MFFPSSDWQTKNTPGGSRSILHLEIKGIKTKNLLMSHQKAMRRMIVKTDCQRKNTRGSRSRLYLKLKGIKTKKLLMPHQKAMHRMIVKTDWKRMECQPVKTT